MRTFVLISAFLAAMGAGTALAATFCVVGTTIPPQCMYDDIPTCTGASSPPATYCAVNPEATLTYYGSQRFCSVQSDRLAQCAYATRGQCESGGGPGTICIDKGETAESISPYRYDKRTQE